MRNGTLGLDGGAYWIGLELELELEHELKEQ